MTAHDPSMTLDAGGMQRFRALQVAAVQHVGDRFYTTHGSAYERFGERGREACREDLAFHLEFLRPVLEFGLLQPMVDYLCWLGSVLAARAIPDAHLAQSLDWLGEFFAERLPAGEGAAVAAALRAARDGFLAAGATPYVPQAPAPWPEAAELESALLAGDQRAALALMNTCLDAGRRLVDFEMHVVQPAMYRIGERWQANQVSVAQEHLATAIVQSLMTVGLLRAPLPVPVERRVLLACVESNQHALGLRMVADAFMLAGWDVQYLGANVPLAALVRQVLDWQPQLIGLSVAFPHQLPAARALIAQLDAQLGAARPAVLIGGLALNRFRPLAEAVGADACGADAEAALNCAEGMLKA